MHHWKRWIGTGLQEYDDNNPMLQSSKLPLACKASAKNSSKGSASLREDLSWSWKVVKIPAIFVSTFSTESPHNMRKHMSRLWFQKWIPASMTWKPGSLRLFLPGASPLLGSRHDHGWVLPQQTFAILHGPESYGKCFRWSIFQASHRWMPLNICQLLTIL